MQGPSAQTIDPGQNELYIELQLKKIDKKDLILKDKSVNKEIKVMIIVNDITKIIENQQKLSDNMYQDAIEANYSHEQMTPLNSILMNSKLAINRVLKMQKIINKQR